MSTTKTVRKQSRPGKTRRGVIAVPAGKTVRRPGTTAKRASDQPAVLDMVEASLRGLGKVKDIKTTLREFDRLRYPAPKEYAPAEIIRLREKKLRMSQAAFALACNAKLSTLQKWESGVNKPTPPVNRLFQLIERGGLAFLEGRP
jgi:putative transcriptional regulator